MKLSEAIRLGAMLRPQGIGGDMDGATRCALAAASDAAGIAAYPGSKYCNRPTVDYAATEARWPVLRLMVDNPLDGYKAKWMVRDTIWLMNDTYGWTREQIADWVDGIERAQEQSTAASTSAVLDAVDVLVESH